MEQQEPFYIQKIKEDFTQRQRRSPSYSLRAYARDLGLHAATLSMMFKGMRGLPLKKSLYVVEKLGLGPKERTYFLESLRQGGLKLDEIKVSDADQRFMLDESYHNVLAEWEHYAVLTLFDCDNFDPNALSISERLNISLTRSDVVLNNLLSCGLLKKCGNKITKTHQRVRSTEDVTSSALQKGHIETLEMGKEKLLQTDVNERDFSSIMLAINPEKIPDVKLIIREFRQKLAVLVKDGKRSEVYQLAIQFYPLTHKQNKE